MRPASRSVAWALALPAWWLLAGCAPQPGDEAPPVIETEDVGPAPDQELDLSADRKAKARSRASGMLPGSFPEGLPVYEPASIADIGGGDSGGFVQFVSPDDADRVRNRYRSALASAGWSVEESPGGGLVAGRGGRRVGISIIDSGPVTLIQVDY